MNESDKTPGWEAARETAVPEKGGLTLPVPGGGEIFFRKIPAGRFLMGQRGEQENEEPVTEQRVEEFYLGTFPVTQRQFRAWTESDAYARWWEENQDLVDENVRETHRNEFEGNDLAPAERMTWDEAVGFAQWLGMQEAFREELMRMGLDRGEWQVTLPGEGQWECACRGRSRTGYSLGEGKEVLERQGWFDENGARKTHAVGLLAAGPHGVFDMHGNVNEWVLDFYHERALRELLPDGPVAVRSDDAPGQSVPNWWTRSQRFFGKVLEGERVVRDGNRDLIGHWQGILERQELNEQSRVCERALMVQEGRDAEWPAEDQGLAQGIFDLVSQWIRSAGKGEDRVLRGGSWDLTAWGCRSAYRLGLRPGRRDRNFGFRLALVPGPVPDQSGGPEARERAEPGAAAEEAGDPPDQTQGEGGATFAEAPDAKADLNANFPPRSGGDFSPEKQDDDGTDE